MKPKTKTCRSCNSSFVPIGTEEYCNKCSTFKINTREVKHNGKQNT